MEDAPKQAVAPTHAGKVPLKAELYPQFLMPIVRELGGEADEFDLVREKFLLSYSKNTARAYWADLEYWRDWCLRQQPRLSPTDTTTENLDRYLAELAGAGYAPRTVGRRRTIIARFGQNWHPHDTEPTIAHPGMM